MRILFYGDSITDAGRDRDNDDSAFKLGLGMGMGYANFVTGTLMSEKPGEYEFINRGVSGNRSVDLYARIKVDCWNYQPDVVSVLVGINYIWPDTVFLGNGVEVDRFEKVYRMLIEDTKAKLPSVKMILCEPFFLEGSAAAIDKVKWEHSPGVREYAKVVEKLANEYGLPFVALQEKLLTKAAEHGAAYYLFDGIHPTPAGAKLIADEWLKVFKEQVKK